MQLKQGWKKNNPQYFENGKLKYRGNVQDLIDKYNPLAEEALARRTLARERNCAFCGQPYPHKKCSFPSIELNALQ